MLVTGSGTVATGDTVYVGGYDGTGTLTISDGGVLNTRYYTFLASAGDLDDWDSVGTVTVTGSGSQWNTSTAGVTNRHFYIGIRGDGTLNVVGCIKYSFITN